MNHCRLGWSSELNIFLLEKVAVFHVGFPIPADPEYTGLGSLFNIGSELTLSVIMIVVSIFAFKQVCSLIFH